MYARGKGVPDDTARAYALCRAASKAGGGAKVDRMMRRYAIQYPSFYFNQPKPDALGGGESGGGGGGEGGGGSGGPGPGGAAST